MNHTSVSVVLCRKHRDSPFHEAKQRGTYTPPGGNVTTRQTCAGSQQQTVAHSLPLLWFLVTSPAVSADLQLIALASSFPSSEESNAEDRTTESSIPLIPVNNVSVVESYQRLCGAMQKAAHHSIP